MSVCLLVTGGSSLVSDSKNEAGAYFLSILTFIILYNNLVPISLIVTLEVRGQHAHTQTAQNLIFTEFRTQKKRERKQHKYKCIRTKFHTKKNERGRHTLACSICIRPKLPFCCLQIVKFVQAFLINFVSSPLQLLNRVSLY